MNSELKIVEFIRLAKLDKNSSAFYARLPRTHPLIQSRTCRAIRSSKNKADAIVYDLLGNATVLFSDGSIKQLISEDEIKKAGILS